MIHALLNADFSHALETLLVHRDIAAQFLAAAGRALLERGVRLRVDEAARHTPDRPPTGG